MVHLVNQTWYSYITGNDINVCPIPVKTDVGQVDLVLRLSDGTSEKIRDSQTCRCIRLDGPAARCSGRPKLPRQFVPVRNFEPRLFVPMPGNMGRPAFTFINLYIFCNLQRIINKNIHLGYVCTYIFFNS